MAGDKRISGKLIPGSTQWKLEPKWFMTGFASKWMPNISGYHNLYILKWKDEACGIDKVIYDGLHSLGASGDCHDCDTGNPDTRQSEFFNCFRNRNYKKFTISCFDTPNFAGLTLKDMESGDWKDKVINPLPFKMLINPSWVAGRLEAWGVDSPLFLSKCLAEFPTQDEDVVFPEHLMGIAAERESRLSDDEILIVVDPARMGQDRTVIGILDGNNAQPTFMIRRKQRLTDCVGNIRNIVASTSKVHRIIVDVTGLGAGVVDPLVEKNLNVVEINFGGAGGVADDETVCHDARTLMAWQLRCALKDWMHLEHNDEISSELIDIRYKTRSDGAVQLESKDEIKKRLKRSPDVLDVLMMMAGWRKVGKYIEGDFDEAVIHGANLDHGSQW